MGSPCWPWSVSRGRMLCLREPRWRSPAGQDCWRWAAAALLVGGYRLVAEAAPGFVSCDGHRCHSAGHASRCRPSLRGRGPQLRAGPVGVSCTGNRNHPWAPAPITTGGPRAASGRQPVDRDLAHRAGRAGPQVDVGALRSSEAGDRPRCPLAPSQRHASTKPALCQRQTSTKSAPSQRPGRQASAAASRRAGGLLTSSPGRAGR